MTVSALPFTTALMAAYLKESQGESLAAAVYSGSFLLMGIVFAGMNRHILFERANFLEEDWTSRPGASPSNAPWSASSPTRLPRPWPRSAPT